MVEKLAGLLKGAATIVRSPFGGPHHVAQEHLASSWTSLRLAVMRGYVSPATPVFIDFGNEDKLPGSMTVQAILKTVEDGWGHWDRRTTEWWCRVLEDANSRLISEA